MYKPGFGVVTGVVTVLAVIAFVAKLVIGHIPEGSQNRLAGEPSVFLNQAGTEEIDWHTLSEETFAEARKRDLPIMLVVGSACSPTGRAADEYTFKAKEIEDYLDRNFISVRLDAMEYPEYINAFLPLSRAIVKGGSRLGMPPDFQVWFLDPKGYLFGFAAETTLGQGLDARSFRLLLERAINLYSDQREKSVPPGEIQSADQAALREAIGTTAPDLDEFGGTLADATSPEKGGFPVNGFQRLWPSAWRFQLLSGRLEDYAKSIGPCLTSPRFDVLHGGFFTPAARYDWRGIGFDKVAVVNADMLRTLSLGAALQQSREQRWLAERTFDYLVEGFPAQGVLAGGQLGDENRFGRSEASSFSPRELRELFPDNVDRDWLRTNLGLRVETNPEMAPMLADLDLPFIQKQKLETVLEVLRKKTGVPKESGSNLLDVGGTVIARLIESARILGDRERLGRATALFRRLEDFRSTDDVVHSLSIDNPQHAYLGDYLAYSDAALEQFLSTGDPDAFEHGLAVLRRSLFLFGTKDKGIYVLSQPGETPLAPQNVASPEIVDNLGESCTAKLMRLCTDYGRLLGPSGADVTRAANDCLHRFASLAPGLGQFAGGYYCSAERMTHEVFAIAVGPKALDAVRSLASRNPLIFAAPAAGKTRMAGSEPGMYVLRAGKTTGPVSLSKAAELLSGAPD